MAIRTELLSPTSHVFGPGTYIAIVSEHGTIMMMMATSVIVGPLGNWLVPLMIGARRTAFPRVEAFSFWIFTAGYLVILSALFYGGFPTGWTGYAPLQTQASGGMDSYLVGFAVIGLGMIAAGFNLAVTIINYRAPGMTWSRLPIFVWAILATCALLTLATPTLVAAGLFGILDRTAQTAFYVTEHGGSSFLWQNLFWFFGHPEVYIMALPGFGIVGEILPVFTRKPLFAYKVAAAGMIGVALLSFFVWQHHLFQSGINPDMRPLFMLTTELISIPTGFIFLVGLGTLYKAKIRFEVPMLFALAVFFNFLIGGITGVFLSDVPVNVTVHGGFFVLAHFHYTIMGGLIFAFFGGLYFWLPEDDRQDHEQEAGADPLLVDVRLLQPDLLPDVLHRPARPAPPGVRVRRQPAGAQRLLVGERLHPRCLVPGVHRQLRVVDLHQAHARPGQSLGLARTRVADADPGAVLQLRAHPGRPRRPVPLQRGERPGGRRPRRGHPGGRRGLHRHRRRRRPTTTSRMSGEPTVSDITPPDLTDKPLFTETPEEREFELRAAVGAYWSGGRLLIGIYTFLFASLAFAYFYLRSSNSGQLWRPGGVTAPTGLGWAIFAIVFASALLTIFGNRRLQGVPARLGGGRVDGRPGRPAGHRSPDLPAHPAARSSRGAAGTPRASSGGR